MSRFFATGDTDTESSSESSDEEPRLVGARGTGAALGMKVFTFSDDEEEEKRVVRSQKDKRYDELKNLVHAMKNSQKIKDIAKLQTGFETLQKAFQKAKTVIVKEGTTPIFYVRTLVQLEDFIQSLWEDREAKQKLSKVNAKALGTLKQKVRKYNKDFEKDIQSYRENPVTSDAEQARDSSAAEEEEEEDEAIKSLDGEKEMLGVIDEVAKKPLKEIDSDEDDDTMWDSTEESESASEDDGLIPGMLTAEYFLKKDPAKKKDDGKAKQREEMKSKKAKERKEEEGEWETVVKRPTGQMTKQDILRLLFGKDVKDVDVDMAVKKRDEFMADRGKRTMDTAGLQERLKWLMDIAVDYNLGVGIQLRLIADLMESTFDLSSVATAMKEDMWQSCLDLMTKFMDLLEANPEVEFSTIIRDEEENFKATEGKPIKVMGNVLTMMERTDDEFIKLLQNTDAHSTDYVTKLQGEKQVYELIKRMEAYLEPRFRKSRPDILCSIYIRRIEHLYYKIDRRHLTTDDGKTKEETEDKKKEEEGEDKEEEQKEEEKEEKEEEGEDKEEEQKEEEKEEKEEEGEDKEEEQKEEEKEEKEEEAKAVEEDIRGKGREAKEQMEEEKGGEKDVGADKTGLINKLAEVSVIEDDSLEVISRLTKFIYSCTSEELGRIRTRAMLCQIYHHALHDRWYQAKDLMMMSHLQEGIHLADVPTQILYNRSLVQLGMCAFRHGMIKDAHDALMDVQSSGRSKELIAQGLISRHERSIEQQKVERRRQIPFHMHINLELMECVYLTSAMLMEVPYMAAYEAEGRRRIISKSFHHQLRYHEKQPLVGPPESMREHVVAATHAMRKGNWKKCLDYILNIKVWDLFIKWDQVKEMLKCKIQEETLRTFIFTYSETYDSLSLERLSQMFALPLKEVHSVVSKMIIKEELLASLDEPTRSIVLHHAKPNKLQCKALLLAEKISTLADHNEELMKLKHAGPWSVQNQSSQFMRMSHGNWQNKFNRRGPHSYRN